MRHAELKGSWQGVLRILARCKDGSEVGQISYMMQYITSKRTNNFHGPATSIFKSLNYNTRGEKNLVTSAQDGHICQGLCTT